MNLRKIFFNPPGERDPEKERQRSAVILFACIALTVILLIIGVFAQ